MEACVFLMVKYPEPRLVKARLAKSVNHSIAAELYRNFILDSLTTLQRSNLPFIIAYHPARTLAKFQDWLGGTHEYLLQKGDDLGERLNNGFTEIFAKGYNRVLALASDCPDIPDTIIHDAQTHLLSYDAVIGPSPDGGYYLIGFQAQNYLPETFEGITWSTETVFTETLTKLENHNRRVYTLPVWRDIDTLEDLKQFYIKNRKHQHHPSNTMIYLNTHPNILSQQPSKPSSAGE